MNETVRSLFPTLVYAGLLLFAGGGRAGTVSVTTTNDVRTLSDVNANNNSAGDPLLSLYNGAGNQQRTWINFDFSPYAGKTMSSGRLTLVAYTQWGGNLTGVGIGFASAPWSLTGITWNNQPSITPIAGAVNPNGVFGDGAQVSWIIPAAALQSWADGVNTNGLGLTSAAGSTCHFKSSRNGSAPSLVFTPMEAFASASSSWTNAGAGAWSEGLNWLDHTPAGGVGQTATFAEPTGAAATLDADRMISALVFDNADHTVTGTNTLALERGASLPSISVGAGRTAAVRAVLASAEGFDKTGPGTLVVANGTNVLYGTTTVKEGTLSIGSRYSLDKTTSVVVEDGAVLQSGAEGATGTSYGTGVGPITVKAGGTLRAASVANVIRRGLTLNGGKVDATVPGNGSWGNFVMESVLTVGGTNRSVITADLRMRDDQTVTVSKTGDTDGIDLLVAGRLGHINGYYWGYVTKAGAGTLAVTNPVNDTGKYTVNSGRLLFVDHMAGGGNGGISVASGAAVEARISASKAYGYAVAGAGALVKTGAGRLALAGTTHTGPTVVSNGTLSASVMVGAARHFDASSLNLTNGAAVTQWDDLSGSGAHATVPSGNASPTYVSNAVPGGLPALYFPKNSNASNSGALQFARDSAIRSVFSVFKGNSFLLTANNNTYHFHRKTDDNPADPLWDSQYAHANLTNGANYVNAALVPTPAATAMPTNSNSGFNLIEVVTTGNVTADSFNKDRGTIHAGNQYHAEMAIFDSAVSEARRLQIEAYLNKKWFGAGAGVGNLFSVSSPVTLFNGATLDFSCENYQTLASLASTDGLGSKVTLGSAALTVGNASTNTFDGAISGVGGSLTKVGSGMLTLAGTNSYTGATAVQAGTLCVSGALAGAGPVGVASNAMLSGTGVVAGTVSLAAGSALSPGATAGAVGTLTVGALQADAGGTLQVDAQPDGSCDVLAVQGAANASGAKLTVSDSSVLSGRNVYTVLTCAGTPAAFASVSVPGGWSVVYRDGSVRLVSMGTLIRVQ